MSKSVFSPVKILITAIVLFVLTIVNVVAYYALGAIYKSLNECSDNPYWTFEEQLDSYPSFTGTVKEIKHYDEIASVMDWDDPEDFSSTDAFAGDSLFKDTDSVRVGDYYLSNIYININGRWFYSDQPIHVWDSISDSEYGLDISVGSKITVAYGQKEGIDGYDYIYAIKPDSSHGSSSSTGYILFVLIPSIAVLIFSLLLIFLGNRSGALRIVSIVMIALALICGLLGTYCVTTYLQKSKQAVQVVRAHAPVIYLYNVSPELVNVRLDIKGGLTCTYPKYDPSEGWNIKASPDGTLTDLNGRDYEYLFWEADLEFAPDLSHGFCVKGEDSALFLEKSLKQLGLTDTEANAFIMYWLPQMEANEYNVISFQTDAYEDSASLQITPEPDTVIRVNMLWYPSDVFVDIEPQELSGIAPSAREGFTVVEWGGEILGE